MRKIEINIQPYTEKEKARERPRLALTGNKREGGEREKWEERAR